MAGVGHQSTARKTWPKTELGPAIYAGFGVATGSRIVHIRRFVRAPEKCMSGTQRQRASGTLFSGPPHLGPGAPSGHGPLNVTLDFEVSVTEPLFTRGVGPRIVGGTTISPLENPWMVHISMNFPGYSTLCGGTYIGSASSTSHYFLTVAQCIPTDRSNLASYYVSFLRDDLDDAYDEDGFYFSQPYYAALLHVHPLFNTTDTNDIAIVETNAYASPSTLPSPVSLATAASLLKDGTSVQVLGYGTTSEYGELDNELRSAYLNVVNSGTCASAYEVTSDEVDFDQYICAAAPGKDTCQGDAGGPLFLTQGSQDVQLGITSFGYGCAREGYPGIYTRVAFHTDWIDSVVGSGLVSYVEGSGSDGEYVMSTSSSPASLRIFNIAFVLSIAAAIFVL
ncbi:Serine protease 30 [Hondaea fermentalgiana]|uniref:Serine protease 30 n=1 Tax=Hondaea fermentalgiana TaxID=2315210 RepID=A0A2R5G6S8_9STRA|nr:Serine protease 30 [Hondaea fermentalgiana]|eukprot:GBG25498.1 Serine protease 30 [Hondaea fermentalgiana]